MLISLLSWIYNYLIKPVFFLFDPETVHSFVSGHAELIGKINFLNNLISKLFSKKPKELKQKFAGISFNSPVGLAAGFDYEAKCVKILPSVGFGFNTIGTITHLEYGGNPQPRLGRLPKSKSLMVYKGFKNKGALWTAEKLSGQTFEIPLGISIGLTNPGKNMSKAKSSSAGQKTAIEDILSAFRVFEHSNIKSSYYELNISCPNLYGNITFYFEKNLNELLTAVDKLKLKKPLFIKMPISESDQSTKKMLDVISDHNVAGVIIGNLQKDRKNPMIYKDEAARFKHGNFSGLPTQKRSDELISLAYKYTKGKLLIIGCGGIFSTQDAYRKIKLGASLVQLITGLIYEGPLLVAKINRELPVLMKKDGFKNITEAIGADNN